jgi:hypothetical protein
MEFIMPSKNQTVTKINKTTLERIRKMAKDFNTSVPKMIDLMTNSYEITRVNVERNWKMADPK